MGVFKFRARWLVRSSGLPEDALARLQAARLAFGDDNHTCRGAKANSVTEDGSPPSKHACDLDDDEVFLTNEVVDLDVSLIIKPIILCAGETTEFFNDFKGKIGPRLTHAFDASSGDFIAVERTHAIIKRARARFAEATALTLMLAEDAAATKSGKSVTQSNGWLLPKPVGPRESGGGRFSDITTSASVRDTESEGDHDESDNNERDKNLRSDETERELQKYYDESDSRDTDYRKLSDVPSRNPARGKHLVHDKDVEKQPSPLSSWVEPPEALPTQHVSPSLSEHQEPARKRSRRLAMPPVEEPGLSLGHKEEQLIHSCPAGPTSAAADEVGYHRVRARKDGVGTGGRNSNSLVKRSSPVYCSSNALDAPDSTSAERLSPSKLPSSITGERKRVRLARVGAGEAGESSYAPRHTRIGDDYQVDIPDLLSVQERKNDASHVHTGADSKMVCMVQCSFRRLGEFMSCRVLQRVMWF